MKRRARRAHRTSREPGHESAEGARKRAVDELVQLGAAREGAAVEVQVLTLARAHAIGRRQWLVIFSI